MTTHQASLDTERPLGLSRVGLSHAARRVANVVAFGALPCLLLVVILGSSVANHFAFDFQQFWQGGRDVANGHSPYPPSASLPSADGATRLDAVEIQDVFRFPYPAPAALTMVPFGLLPFDAAAALFVVVSLAAILLALRCLGVADWRCYGVLFASMATLGALRLGTFTCLLLLGLALAWRFRDRPLVVAAVVAVVVSLKLFLWPLLAWLLLTRRLRATALALVFAGLLTLGSWAVIGFAGLTGYPHLLSSLAASVQGKGWSMVALALSLGLSAAMGKVMALALSGGLFAIALRASPGRRDVALFAVAIAAALLLSPIVWLHYFLLLAAPLAIASPRFAPAWLLPLLFWIWPFQETGGDAWKIVLGLGVLLAVVATTLVSRPAVSSA